MKYRNVHLKAQALSRNIERKIAMTTIIQTKEDFRFIHRVPVFVHGFSLMSNFVITTQILATFFSTSVTSNDFWLWGNEGFPWFIDNLLDRLRGEIV